MLLLTLAAFAFQPPPGPSVDSLPTHVRGQHVERQHALRHGSAWQTFLAGEGRGWQARFDERTGAARRASGPGIPLNLSHSAVEVDVVAAFDAFLHRNEGLVGVPADRIRLAHAAYVRDSDHWILRFDQVTPLPRPHDEVSTPSGAAGEAIRTGGVPVVPGAPSPTNWRALGELSRQGDPVVWGGGIVAHIVDGRLVMLGIDTFPNAETLDLHPVLPPETAIVIAIDHGPAPTAIHDIEGAALVVLPREVPGGMTETLCWAVRSRTGEDPASADPPGIWMSFVDARTGELIAVRNEVRFLSGTVLGEHDTRTVDGDLSTAPMAFLSIESDTQEGTTSSEGGFTLEGGALSVPSIAGTYFRIINEDGAEGFADWSDGDLTLTDAVATQAEIDSYVFLSQVRGWLLEHGPDLSYATDRLTSKVNINSSCNAYYDGSINLFQAGNGCNNTGRIADVNYHEWGHGLHAAAAGTWYVDGSVGEGAGDITAFLQTGDSTIGPYFWTNGSGIRDVSADRVYPDDLVGEVHTDGLIFAGAVWDLLGLLAAESSDEAARSLVSDLLIDALRENPDLDETYDAFVAADDDNGDLSDGTPHRCAILDAFSRHGLGPAGSASLLQISHVPGGNQADTAEEYAVTADLLNLAPDCVAADWQGARVVYSTDSGATWSSANLEILGETVSGAIPALPTGSAVSYYVELDAGEAGIITVPSGATINPFSFYVGPLREIWRSDFEDDDGAFTHSAASGKDDWELGTPGGLAGDPDFAYSGVSAWGTDLGTGRGDGSYKDSTDSLLSSPPIDLQGEGRVIVQFARWLNVEDGYYDRARILANGVPVWENHASGRDVGDENHEDLQWTPQTLAVDLDGAASLTLGWEIESDEGLSFGGWNIDDVTVYAIVPPGGSDEVGDEPGRKNAAACGGCSSSAGGGAGIALWVGLGLVGLRRRSGGLSGGA